MERMSRLVYVCVLAFMLSKGFYSAKENATVVLTKHFDFLCNDDCLVGGRTIITVLSGWQVPSADVP